MATAFWLGVDKRLLLLMFFSTASAILLMCGILAAELAIEGFKSRLSWPYDDLVPGNYLAKVGLPVIVFSTTLFLSLKGFKSLLPGGFCLLIIGMTMMTGERINFLIALFAALLAIFIWETSWKKRFFYITVVSALPILIFAIIPSTFDRFAISFFNQLPLYKGSPYYDAMAPAWLIFQQSPTLGIGPGNFRYLCADLIQPELGYPCHNHPHNFYLQILSETGSLGFVSAVIFIGSIIVKCFGAMATSRHVLYSVAWVIPFALFWPIRSSADFFWPMEQPIRLERFGSGFGRRALEVQKYLISYLN
jgi:O-antigen ligase